MPVRFIKTSMVGFFITALQHCCSLGTPVVLFIFSSPDPVSTIGRGPAPCPSSCRMGLSEECLKLCRESFLPQDSVNFPLKMWVSDKQLLFCFFFFPAPALAGLFVFPLSNVTPPAEVPDWLCGGRRPNCMLNYSLCICLNIIRAIYLPACCR